MNKKGKIIPAIIIGSTVLLALVAIFTAYKLYKVSTLSGEPASACHGDNERVNVNCDSAHFTAEAILSSGVTYEAWWMVEGIGRIEGNDIYVPWNGSVSITAQPFMNFSNGIEWTGNSLTANLPDYCLEVTQCTQLTFSIEIPLPSPTATASASPTASPSPTPVPGEPAIDLEKHTNGYDADDPKGPELVEGDSVKWEYIVTNIGDKTLYNITLIDNKEGNVTSKCPKTTLLADETMTCTLYSTARVYQYSNSATVTGEDNDGVEVTDTDMSHYWGEGKAYSPTPNPTSTTTTNGGTSVPKSTSTTTAIAGVPTSSAEPLPSAGVSMPTLIGISSAILMIAGALLLVI